MSDQPVDIAAINELRSIMGEEFSLLIDIFIKDSAERLRTMETVIANNDAEGLRNAAHSFKGSALNISAAKLTELCRQLEYMGRNKQLNGAQNVLELVKIEYEQVKNYFASM